MLQLVPKSEEPDKDKKLNPYNEIREVSWWQREFELTLQVVGLVSAVLTALKVAIELLSLLF